MTSTRSSPSTHDGGLRVWPRILVERGSERWAFDRDQDFDDPEGDGSVWLRKPRLPSPSPSSPPMPPVPPAPGAPRRPPDTSIDTRQSDPADASDDQAPGDRDDFTGPLSRYLAWARESHQHLDMAGVGGGHLRLAIDQVCIPLDGLDEIADPRRRARVCRYLETELARADDRAGSTDIRAAVSCRFAGLGEHIGFGPKFAHLDIHPLDERQIVSPGRRYPAEDTGRSYLH